MNKLQVVAKNKETYFLKRLTEELGQEKLLFFNPWKDPEPEKASMVLVRTTGVYHDDRDLQYLRKLRNQKLINPLESLEIFRKKTSQYEFFERHQIPCLPWLDVSQASEKAAEAFLRERSGDVLVKPILGQGGWGIEVLRVEEFPMWLSRQVERKDLSWVLQPYVKGVELRVFFIEGHRPWVLEREFSAGHRAANFRQGGRARLREMPRDLEPLVSHLIEVSNTFYGAIDLFKTTEGYRVLELNTVPGVEQLEEVSGQNILKTFVKALGLTL